jgi:RLL motif containing protein 1
VTRRRRRPRDARTLTPPHLFPHPPPAPPKHLPQQQIRLYPAEQRRPLENVEDPAWADAFAKYLAELECPLTLGGGNSGNSNGNRNAHHHALRWLLALALSLDYRDSSAELNAAGAEMEQEAQREEEAAAARVAEAAAQEADGGSGGAAAAAAARRQRLAAAQQQAFLDLDAPEVRAEIERLLSMLRLARGGQAAAAGAAGAGAGPAAADDDGKELERQLAVARRAVADEVLPTVGTLAGAGATAASASSCSASAVLAGVPLGLETGDAAVDTAAALLRLLYLRDLRALQSAVDAAVVEVQEYTANPRTDSSLGRVGR